MELRLANSGDIPGILELLRQVGQVHYDLRPDIFKDTCQKYSEDELLDIFRHKDRPVFVAMKGKFVAGYCFCQLREYRGSTVLTDRTELYIDDLCVDENCRGTGVAQALFRHAAAYAKELGCQFVTLNVWCGNAGAQRFYEKMGLLPRSVMMDLPLEETEC